MQKNASPVRTESTNLKYTFRTWLLRMGLIGKEFETARLHLLAHHEGNIALKNPEQAEKQKQMRKAQQELQRNPPIIEILPEIQSTEVMETEIQDEQEQSMGFGLSM